MNLGRLFEVARLDLAHNLRRPLFWVQLLILGFFAWALSNGNASIGSGDARVGGTKAWITSEFANTQMMVILVAVLYVFFASVGAGMSLIRDEELQVGDVLHATRLTPAEYVWGKFLAVQVSFLAVLALHVGLTMFFNHVLPHGTNADYIGPFVLGNYLRPALLFGVPMLVLFCGACFAIGAITRQPVLVFGLPIAQVLIGSFFLWEWSPSWLSPEMNRLLEMADLSGFRWLNETYLEVDRGVNYYNTASVGLDGMMWGQRLVSIALGLGAVALAQAHFSARLRGTKNVETRPVLVRLGLGVVHRLLARFFGPRRAAAAPAGVARLEPALLSRLGMRSGAPGFWAGALEVAATEFKLLGRHPGIYLFVPMILLEIFGDVVSVGAFDTPRLQTSGALAVSTMNTLTLLISMVILFYTTESLQRERSTRLGAISYASPLRTGALLLGKSLANMLLGAAIVTAALAGCGIVLAIQGKVGFDLVPFALVWGLLLMPTFLFWTAFIGAVFSISGSRAATYALGLGAMSLTGWFQLRGKMNWVANWNLWSATRWSDISGFEFDWLPLTLNRIEVLGFGAALIALTVAVFARRERDATRNMHRLRASNIGRVALASAPWLVIPLAAAITLGVMLDKGWQGSSARKLQRDYWKKNTLNWKDAPLPSITFADIDVAIDPKKRWIKSRGYFDLVNHTGAPLRAIPITGDMGWKNVSWTLNDSLHSPEERAGLRVFHFDPPIPPEQGVRIGWAFDSGVPYGISKNGAGQMEFILPSSVVLTGFSSTNLGPYIGYQPDLGVEADKNQADPREYRDDFHLGRTPAGIAMAESWFNTRMRVTLPAGMQVEATGVMVSDSTRGGHRITEWKSDHPVRIYNLVAGYWKQKKGDGVVVNYDPRHTYNVDEMLEALEGARRWYGEWFAPFPWRELRLTEFAAMASYAQGSPGNITFSEGIGFLTRSEPKANAAFWITAHEAAHQWWPNMAMTGEGPGGDVLSEGMSHFSTILLTEQVKGLEQRMAFCRQIEDGYGNIRRRDSERPMVKVNGELPGDRRIIYDKGGWVLWMLFQQMGREAGFAAQRDYLETYRDSRDHALLPDYLAIMRKHAADTTAFDAFVKQWFYEVVVSQYFVSDARTVKSAGGWEVHAKIKNTGGARMPVEVAATRGERFAKDADGDKAYHDSRVTITLGAGEELPVVIPCEFEPQKLVVDPDVRVLQLNRKKATVLLKTRGERGANTAGRAKSGGRPAARLDAIEQRLAQGQGRGMPDLRVDLSGALF
ncbi:MAG: hypothetical protein ABIS67_06855 [Candidatus Eisenbacteria bacterium]